MEKRCIVKVSTSMPTQRSPGAGLICLRPSVGQDIPTFVCTPATDPILKKHYDTNIRFLFYNSVRCLLKNKRWKRIVQILDNVLLFTRLVKKFKYARPSVIVCFGMINSVGCVVFSLLYRTPLVISLHNITDYHYMRKSSFLRWLLNRSSEVWVCSKELEREIKSMTNRPVFYRPTGYDPQEFYSKNHAGRFESQRLISVGSFKWKKNYVCLVEAFALFVQRCPDATLTLVGDGELKGELQERVDRLGLSKSVKFMGILSQEDLANELSKSSAFILVSLAEGRPKVVAEALGTGLPCIVSGACNCDDLVIGAGVSLHNVVTQESIVKALNDLLSNEKQWNLMSETAMKRASAVTWSAIAEREQIQLRRLIDT